MDGPPRPRSTPKVGYTIHGMLQAIVFVVAIDSERLGGGDGTFRPGALYLPAMAVAGVVPFVLGLVLDRRGDRWPDRLPSLVRVLLFAGPPVGALCLAVARGEPPGSGLFVGALVGLCLDQLLATLRALAVGGWTTHARRGWQKLAIGEATREGRLHHASALDERGERVVVVSEAPLPEGAVWVAASRAPHAGYRDAPTITALAFETDDVRRHRRDQLVTAALTALAFALWAAIPLLAQLGARLGERVDWT